MNILSHFPKPEIWVSQEETLLEVEKKWSASDVIVIKSPVGTGKSAMAETIQDWQGGGVILAPSNIHVKQYLDDSPGMRTVWAQRDYHLETGVGPRGGTTYTPVPLEGDNTVTEEWYRKNVYQHGTKNSQYSKDLQYCRLVKSKTVSNYMTYIAHKFQRKVLIVDEAHQLLNAQRNQAAKRLWQHQFGYPESITTLRELYSWLDSVQPSMQIHQTMRNILATMKPSTTVEFVYDFYRGEEMPCIRLAPLDCSEEPPIYWPPRVKKIILMSATINAVDIQAMGLGNRRVLTIDVDSPIPEENRPVLLCGGESMSHANLEDSLLAAVAFINECLEMHSSKGFVHGTYTVASMLKPLLSNDRLMFHHQGKNKRKVYDEFLESDPALGKVMIGSGLHEGIDLKYDLARWQIMLQCPWPSLMDPGYRWMSDHDPNYYLWSCTREVLQASGRICRGPTDKGLTYLWAHEFSYWLKRAKEADQIPAWFNPQRMV